MNGLIGCRICLKLRQGYINCYENYITRTGETSIVLDTSKGLKVVMEGQLGSPLQIVRGQIRNCVEV